jgi:hypothetical protein
VTRTVALSPRKRRHAIVPALRVSGRTATLKKSIAVAVALCALLPVATADARYTISKREADNMARQAAQSRYGAEYGITYADTIADCKPQYVRYNPRYAYHRWKCPWAGRDSDGDIASGVLRITGHTGDGMFGHLVLVGITWD